MTDRNEKNEIVPTAPSGLAAQGSNLVRRGLDDLSKLAGRDANAETGIKNAKDLYRLGRYEEAIACFDRVLELLPGVIDAWWWKGVALYVLDRFEESLVCFNRMLEMDPHNFGAWVNKGSTLEKLGRPDDSLQCYRRALELSPDSGRVWYEQGRVLDRLGRLDDAMRSYDKAIELDTRASLGRDDEDAGRFAQRRPHSPDMGKFVVIDSSATVSAWGSKGVILHNQGRYIDALACCDKAIELDPTFAPAWGKKGGSLMMLNRFSEALACCERACLLDANDPENWYHRARAEEGLGRERDAVNSFQRFLGLVREPEWQAKIEDARRRLQNLKTGDTVP